MIYLATAGEWSSATFFLALTFVPPVIGVAFLGWWVLRGDRRNRAFQEPPDAESEQAPTHESPQH